MQQIIPIFKNRLVDLITLLTPDVKRLCGFERLVLRMGESKNVNVQIIGERSGICKYR